MNLNIPLPPIRKTSDGFLPRMNSKQRKRANSLIRRECCNYENGNCLALDDGEPCVCVQSISYSVCCKWFRWAVLPLDKELEAEIFRDRNMKQCVICGASFHQKSNRSKYCDHCAQTVRRRQKAQSERKRRSSVDN